MEQILQLISFIAILYLWGIVPFQFLSNPTTYQEDKIDAMKKQKWLYYSIDILYLIMAGFALLVGAHYAALSELWLTIAIFVLMISFISLAGLLMKINVQQEIDIDAEFEKMAQLRKEQIPKKRRIAVVKIVVTVVWIYAWSVVKF